MIGRLPLSMRQVRFSKAALPTSVSGFQSLEKGNGVLVSPLGPGRASLMSWVETPARAAATSPFFPADL